MEVFFEGSGFCFFPLAIPLFLRREPPPVAGPPPSPSACPELQETRTSASRLRNVFLGGVAGSTACGLGNLPVALVT